MALVKIRSKKQLKRRLKRQGLDRVGTNKTIKDMTDNDLLDLLNRDKAPDYDMSDEERQDLESDGWDVIPSSAVKAIRLTGDDIPRLEIEFVTGSVYEWITNAKSHYDNILGGSSAGTYVVRFLYGKHSRRVS